MRFRLPTFFILFARLAIAQTPDTTHRPVGATISGIVSDSIAHTPLAGATVQLVAADDPAGPVRTAISDSLGRFSISDVPDGRFTIGFLHPILDSLGVDAPLREAYVTGHRAVRADLAVPSPARIRTAICGPRTTTDSAAVVIGVVHDANDGSPVAGATVTGEWLELSFGANGLVRRMPRLVATTGDNGWFALCNVPSAGSMALIASRGSDSTDRIDVEVPAEGFLRRELYLGSANIVVAVAAADTARHVDSLPHVTRRVRSGNGRLSGTVVSLVGKKPLAGAQVSIVDGPQTRANDRGEWTLVQVPTGTRLLEIRALGYYPERRRVDVVSGAPRVDIALATLQAVLDTVKVRASRVSDRHLSGFEDRRKTGMGYYMRAEDVARRAPLETSDIFKSVPGVYVIGDTIMMRGGGQDRVCSPTVFINGHDISSRDQPVSGSDINDWVRPNEVVAVEVYAGVGVPPEFQRPLDSCGSILIWTK